MTQQIPKHASSDNLSSDMRQGILSVGFGSAVSMVLLFIETMIAVRLLSTDQYGIYVLLIALVNFLVAVDLGSKTAATQMIASSDSARRQDLVGTMLTTRIAIVIVLALLVWLAGEPLLALLNMQGKQQSYLFWIPLMLLGSSFEELLLGLLQGLRAYRQMAIAQILRSLLRLALTVLFLGVFGMGLEGLVYSWIAASLVSVLYQYTVLPLRHLRMQIPVLREAVRFGFPLQLTRLLWIGFRRMGIVLLATFAGPASVAFYEVAARIPDALQNLTESYTAVYFPTVTTLLARGERAQALHILNQTVRLISFILALGAIGATVFSHEIITLLFSEKYAASVPAFVLLMLALQVTATVSLMGYTLTAAGYPGRSLIENTTRVGANLVGDLILIPLLGFVGPAVARLGGSYLSVPVAAWLLRRSDVDVEILPAAKQIAVLLSCAALFWWLQPVELIYKVSIIGLFLFASVALSLVSLQDLNLIGIGGVATPKVVKETASHG